MASLLESLLDMTIVVLGFWIAYSTYQGFRRSKILRLKVISIIFFLTSVVHLSAHFMSEILGYESSISELDEITIVIAFLALGWAIRPKPGWRKPLQKKPLIERPA